MNVILIDCVKKTKVNKGKTIAITTPRIITILSASDIINSLFSIYLNVYFILKLLKMILRLTYRYLGFKLIE